MRRFHGLLFLGAGGWSVAVSKLLHKRLDEGLSLSGGLQQGDHPESAAEAEAGKEADRQAEEDLLDVARDIVAALTGRRISFSDHLPYPWDSSNFKFCPHGKTEDEACLADEQGRPPGCGRSGYTAKGWDEMRAPTSRGKILRAAETVSAYVKEQMTGLKDP